MASNPDMKLTQEQVDQLLNGPIYDPPRLMDAVRIHQAKGRGLLPPQAERLHFRFDKLRPIPEDSEPEQPYKDDPRYGTWG
jgi:hypothetical protein